MIRIYAGSCLDKAISHPTLYMPKAIERSRYCNKMSDRHTMKMNGLPGVKQHELSPVLRLILVVGLLLVVFQDFYTFLSGFGVKTHSNNK